MHNKVTLGAKSDLHNLGKSFLGVPIVPILSGEGGYENKYETAACVPACVDEPRWKIVRFRCP